MEVKFDDDDPMNEMLMDLFFDGQLSISFNPKKNAYEFKLTGEGIRLIGNMLEGLERGIT